MKKMMDFFGLNLNQQQFDINYYAEGLGFKKIIIKDPKIKTLVKTYNAKHPIVIITKRQALLKHMRPLLNDKILAYDQYWYTKENNTSSDHDRLYGAQEKLLQLGLIVATGKLLRHLTMSDYKPDAPALRRAVNTSSKGRFDAFWEILNNETRDYIMRYKRREINPGNSDAAKGGSAKPSKNAAKTNKQNSGGKKNSGKKAKTQNKASVMSKLMFWKKG